jgi:alpha-glucosidase
MLTLYRTALQLRRTLPALRSDCFDWQPSAPDVLAFDRGQSFRCVVNLSGQPIAVDPDVTVLLASTDLTETRSLPPDTALWLRTNQ